MSWRLQIILLVPLPFPLQFLSNTFLGLRIFGCNIEFFSIDQQSYERSTYHLDLAKIITTKLKRFRMALKTWKANLSHLKVVISNVKLVLFFVTLLEEFRDISIAK
jgi:hypothetical protein